MTKKILIADDEQNIVISLEFLMKREGFAVCIANDGQEALDKVRSESPDLVLLDVMMPGSLNGLDVCRMLKSRPHPPRVLLLTARGRSEDLDAGLQAGAEAYLVKPFSPLQLIENINEQLESV